MTPQTPAKIVYYVSVLGLLPKKRKETRLEARMEGNSTEEAKRLLTRLIDENSLRKAHSAKYQGYEVSELNMPDGDTLTMRSLFPATRPQALMLPGEDT